jgi:hypothetical protein
MAPFYTLTIDTEEEWDWHSGWPVSGYGVENIQALPRFQQLCDRYGAAPTYFTAYSVLQDARARAVIQELAGRANVEIGLHIHPWNTPPLPERVTARETFLHNLPVELIHAKLQAVYDAHAAAGLRPTSYRGGRYATSPAIQDWLRTHGFCADASAVSYTTWPDDGAPDYRWRTPEPLRRPGEPPLWELPLTRGFTRFPFSFWQRCYDGVEHSGLRRLRLIGIAERLGVVRKIWLNFEQHAANELLFFLRVLRNRELPYVCLTLHSSSLCAGMSPYTRTAADEADLYDRLETVLRCLSEWGFRPATVSNVARRLEMDHASSRHQPAR